MGFFRAFIAVDFAKYSVLILNFEIALPFLIGNQINLQFSTVDHRLILGLATEFRSEKFRTIVSERFRYSPAESARSEALRHSEVYGRVNSKTKLHEKISIQNPAPANRNWKHVFVREILRTEFRVFASIFVPRNGIPSVLFRGMVQKGTRVASIHGAEFRVVFSSLEGVRTDFREFASIFVPQYRNPSVFLLCRMVRNGILRVCFYFCSTVQKSKHFSPLQNGSERNSASFLCCGTAGIPSWTNQLFHLFRHPQNNFVVANCQP